MIRATVSYSTGKVRRVKVYGIKLDDTLDKIYNHATRRHRKVSAFLLETVEFKEISFSRIRENEPDPNQIVLGFDEWEKKEVEVQYRQDSNCFFAYPYTGALYPKFRMAKWRPIENG